MMYSLIAFAIVIVLLVVWIVRRNIQDRKSYEEFLNREPTPKEDEDEGTDHRF